MLRSLVSVAALLALSLALAPARWDALDDAGRARALAELELLPLNGRLLAASERFLGTPYGPSPLGEGAGVDPDPRLRWDLVDCVTFVEETMAIALAPRPGELLDALDHIRYRQGTPTYGARNHLIEAQWLEENAEAGRVRDITSRLGGSDAVSAEKVLTLKAWASALAGKLALPTEAQATGAFALSVLPLDRVLAHAGAFPDGTLLLVVREDGPSRLTRVSHLGWVVQRGGRTYLRHATTGRAAAVVDEELQHFLARQRRSAWKVVGVSLWEVRDPRQRG